jgi:hypothetical protein
MDQCQGIMGRMALPPRSATALILLPPVVSLGLPFITLGHPAIAYTDPLLRSHGLTHLPPTVALGLPRLPIHPEIATPILKIALDPIEILIADTSHLCSVEALHTLRGGDLPCPV